MKRQPLRYEPHHGVPLAVNELSIGMMLFAPMPEREPFTMQGSVAVVDVGYGGAMSQRPGCAWDSYPEVADRARKAFAEPRASSVVLRVDSPGGDALGCFELFQELRDMASAAGKPLLAFVDGTAASAAYAIACSATRIFVPPAGLVGSVGVMVPSVDQTAADAAAGLKYTLFSSGSRKLDGNPHVRMTDDAAAEIKARVNALADVFFDVVAKGRCRRWRDPDVHPRARGADVRRRSGGQGRSCRWCENLGGSDSSCRRQAARGLWRNPDEAGQREASHGDCRHQSRLRRRQGRGREGHQGGVPRRGGRRREEGKGREGKGRQGEGFRRREGKREGRRRCTRRESADGRRRGATRDRVRRDEARASRRSAASRGA